MGFFLGDQAKLGPTVRAGIEWEEANCPLCNSPRWSLLVGTLPHSDLASGSFDVITMWQSLEHVHHPLPVLAEAQRLLVPGGTLVVSVPNIDSLPFRWFGTSWIGLDLPRHLTHFTPPTLRLMLEHAGYRIGSLQLIRHSDWLRSSARLAARQGRGARWQRWLQTRA